MIIMKRPQWVSIGLWGLNKRASALACMWLSIALAATSAIMQFWLGLIMLLAALWYFLAVKWVDENEGWHG